VIHFPQKFVDSHDRALVSPKAMQMSFVDVEHQDDLVIAGIARLGGMVDTHQVGKTCALRRDQ
jgi:hypothetical protein